MALAPFKAARELVDRLLGRTEIEEVADEAEEPSAVSPQTIIESEEAAARIAQELLRDTVPVTQELPPGQQFVVSFSIAAEHYGERWPTLIGRAKILSERVLRRRLGDLVAYREDGDDGLTFVILDTDIVEEDIAPLGEDIVAEILRQLTGGQDQDEFEPRRKSQPAGPEAIAPYDNSVEEAEAQAIEGAGKATEAPREAQPDLGFVADPGEKDFSTGWEFTEGQEAIRKAEYEYRFQNEDQPVPTSADRPNDALDIPIAAERPEAGWQIEALSEVAGQQQSVPGSDTLQDDALGGFSSADKPDAAYETSFAETREPEQPRLDFGSAPELDAPLERPMFSLADTLAELAASRDRANDAAQTPRSDDKPAEEPEFALSETEPEPETEFRAPATLDASDELAVIEPASFDSVGPDDRERPFARSETRAQEEASFEAPETIAIEAAIVESGERDEGSDAAATVSDERPEVEHALVESGDRIEAEIDTPISDDRPEASYDVAPSENHEQPELVTPISEDRLEEEAGVPISGERAETDLAVPSSQDALEREIDVPGSEEREEPSVAIGESRDRAEREYEHATSETETRAEREDEVEQTETREERAYDYGQSEERPRVEPEYIFVPAPERAAAELAIALVDAEPPPTYDLRLRYGAWLDTQADTVTTYVADPSNRGFDGTETPYHRLLAAGPPPERCFELDCHMLKLAAQDMESVRGDGGKLLLGLPVAASTLLRPKYRAQYLQLWRAVDEETRKLTRLTAYHLPQTSASQASDLFGWLRSLARAPIVRIPPRTELLAPLAGLGVHGVSINYSKWHREMGEAAFVDRLARLAKQAKYAKLKLALINIPNRRAVQIGLASGCDYLEVAVLEGQADIPRRLAKINRAKLVGKES
jgi:hypothetical protein